MSPRANLEVNKLQLARETLDDFVFRLQSDLGVLDKEMAAILQHLSVQLSLKWINSTDEADKFVRGEN